MTRNPTASENLLQRFFDEVHTLYGNRFESQTVLSICPWSIQPFTESGEIFLVALPWHDKVNQLLQHQEKLLKACKLMSIDGINVFENSETYVDRHYKLIRVP
jgi:hypothetical protein